MTGKYWTLVIKEKETDDWEIAFGDWNQQAVRDECSEYDRMLVAAFPSNGTQEEIDKMVSHSNRENRQYHRDLEYLRGQSREFIGVASKDRKGQHGTLGRFLEYAADARNWDGSPWVKHANVNGAGTPANNGYICNMKKRGWITTHEVEPGEAVIKFTDAGKAVAATWGISL